MKAVLALATLLVLSYSMQLRGQDNSPTLPKGFVYIQDILPEVAVDLRYCGHHNFMGKPVQGYRAPKAILSKKATQQLLAVEQELNRSDLGLKIFDAYRPQSAVNDFISWAKEAKDQKGKETYYPQVKKANLFREGYIAKRSGHSRGSTVDLTIIHKSSGKELDMGTGFDFLGPQSAHSYLKLTKNQIKNRKLLKHYMEKHGFKAYEKEWWHYTLKNEPFPKTYFNFDVQ
ncbi:M15 family metallopeptidase [Sphingobacterium sp. Mn56C]|uniref:M15 family metallopeptidase n=1 Tax=Sphingobacterium sp. Mn56C TaxID=3395261 RepID=UPI003BEAB958